MNRLLEQTHRVLMVLAPVLAFLGALAYALHSVSNNQQYDNQVIWYAWDLLAVRTPADLFAFLGESHKYPIGYIVPFAAVYKVGTWVIADFLPYHQYLFGRLFTLVWTVGTFFFLYKTEPKYKWESIVLLASSLVFLLFASAIRPHGPVAFWTLLSAYLSFRAVRNNGHRGWIAGSLGAAFMATITLHSGIFAFIFPAWALARSKSMVDIFRAALWCGVAVFAALIAGYWQIFANFSGVLSGSVVGHEGVTLSFDIFKPVKLLPFFIGSDVLLFVCAGYALWKRKTLLQDIPYVPIVIYLVVFFVAFGFQPISAGRFFLATFPFLALLGAPAFAHFPLPVRTGVLIFLCFAWIKLCVLALTPNTYQQIGAFITPQQGLFGAIGQPTYFFPIDSERAVIEEEDVRTMQFMIVPDYSKNITPPAGWTQCLHAKSSPFTKEIVLMWNDTPWAYIELFATRRLGPSMKVYCVGE